MKSNNLVVGDKIKCNSFEEMLSNLKHLNDSGYKTRQIEPLVIMIISESGDDAEDLGYNDLSNDEQFVQAFGNAIYQGFEIKE